MKNLHVKSNFAIAFGIETSTAKTKVNKDKESIKRMKGCAIKLATSLLSAFIATIPAQASIENYLQPPAVNVSDENNVNMATGQVSVSIDTVAIGGDMGLSHSVNGHTNNFSMSGYYGYLDKFRGLASYKRAGKTYTLNGVTYPREILTVSGPLGTHEFSIDESASGVITYESLGDNRQAGDPRHTIEISDDDNYLIWIMPDGTELTYTRPVNPSRYTGGWLNKVKFPNGLIYTIYLTGGVTTNTGFQLKYDFLEGDNDLNTDKQAQFDALPAYSQTRNFFNSNWHSRNPKYIRGINRAVEFCTPGQKDACTLESDWPTATFEWPSGMPTAFYLGQSKFTITDSKNRVTELHYEAHDLSIVDPDALNSAWPFPDTVPTTQPWREGEKYSPRLVGIKPADSKEIKYTYKYKNDFERMSIGSYIGASGIGIISLYWRLSGDTGIITDSTGPIGTRKYFINQTLGQGDDFQNHNETLSVKVSADFFGRIREVTDGRVGQVFFHNDFRNFVKETHIKGEAKKEYFYDDRGNLDELKMPHGSITAKFPNTCSNRKTCNKPQWTKDAKGNQTDYTYHAESGQIETVTLPAPSATNTVRPQTRYSYTAKYASYYTAEGTKETSSDPIYLLTRESFCQKGSVNASGDGCALDVNQDEEGNTIIEDEVVTVYEYEHDNLFMTGKVVTANGESRRTCYQYDIYGNLIGETLPKANLSSCP